MSAKYVLAILGLLLCAGLVIAVAVFAWQHYSGAEAKIQQEQKIAALDRADRINSIPKIIHQIWIGDKAEPPMQWIETWSKDFVEQNPGYVHVLWRDEDLKILEMVNRDLYDAEPTLPGKADIARYELLRRYGGVYIDADIVWLGKRLPETQQPFASRDETSAFDSFLAKTNPEAKIFVACEPHNVDNVGQWQKIGTSENDLKQTDCLLYANSIIGASPENPHVLTIIKHIAATYAKRSAENPAQPWLTTGPFPMTEALRPIDNVTVFASDIFYPADWHADHSAKTVEQLRQLYPDAYTFHYGYSTGS